MNKQTNKLMQRRRMTFHISKQTKPEFIKSDRLVCQPFRHAPIDQLGSVRSSRRKALQCRALVNASHHTDGRKRTLC